MEITQEQIDTFNAYKADMVNKLNLYRQLSDAMHSKNPLGPHNSEEYSQVQGASKESDNSREQFLKYLDEVFASRK